MDQIAHVGVSPSISLKLISRENGEIIFKVFYTTCDHYPSTSQTERHMDRRTRSTNQISRETLSSIAISRLNCYNKQLDSL